MSSMGESLFMQEYDACATYCSFLGCSSLFAARKSAAVATNCETGRVRKGRSGMKD